MNRGDLHRQALVAAWDAFIQAVEAHDDGFTASAEPAFCSQAIGQLRSPSSIKCWPCSETSAIGKPAHERALQYNERRLACSFAARGAPRPA